MLFSLFLVFVWPIVVVGEDFISCSLAVGKEIFSFFLTPEKFSANKNSKIQLVDNFFMISSRKHQYPESYLPISVGNTYPYFTVVEIIF